jgi:hypothetical protein
LHHSAFFFFDCSIVYGTGISFDFFKVYVVTWIVMATGSSAGTQPYGRVKPLGSTEAFALGV